ncbi:MAG: hypothetical protein PHF67_05180 [Candidatus Nanoarchaeia archaeon]|nr:hypothetical protein [Candidatus Nanoarchaeia archaeon]
MPPEKTTKLLTKRKKFISVELPSVKSKIELIADTPEQLNNRTIKLDLTRQLKGKSIEGTFKISLENNKATAHPEKIKLMSYFIRRMIRKRISYVEDSFEVPSQENMILVKPFLITRKKVSRAVRKTLRNKTKNWLEDYISERKNNEIFEEILTNRLQKSLSLMLKKTYPLSLCEIRTIEIRRKLNPEEVPKIKEKPKEIKKEIGEEEVIDQFKEIEDEKIRKAEKEIKEAQEKAEKIEKTSKNEESTALENIEKLETPKKRVRKKKSEE